MKSHIERNSTYNCVNVYIGGAKTPKVNKTSGPKCTTNEGRSGPTFNEILSLKSNIDRNVNIPSRDMTRHDTTREVPPCCSASNGRLIRNPFCTVMGPNLCQYCAMERNRQQLAEKADEILQDLRSSDHIYSRREQAILSRIRNNLDRKNNYETERSVLDPSHFVKGSVARNNTPDVRYLASRTVRSGGKGIEKSKYDIKPMKNVLQLLSSVMANRTSSSCLELPDSDVLPSDKETLSFDLGDGRSDSCFTDKQIENQLKTTVLEQKLTSVYGERYLPPINRKHSISSTISLSDVAEDQNVFLDAHSDQVHHDIGVENDENIFPPLLEPPLLKLGLQLARKEMFLKDTAILPCIKNQ